MPMGKDHEHFNALSQAVARLYSGEDPPKINKMQVDQLIYSEFLKGNLLTVAEAVAQTRNLLFRSLPLNIEYQINDYCGHFRIVDILEHNNEYVLVLSSGQRHYLPKKFSRFENFEFVCHVKLRGSYVFHNDILEVDGFWVLQTNDQRFYIPKNEEQGKAIFDARPSYLVQKVDGKKKRVYPEWNKQPENIKNIFRGTRF